MSELRPDQVARAGNAQLRQTLNKMFPHAYMNKYHRPPNSVCTLMNVKLANKPETDEVDSDIGVKFEIERYDVQQIEPSSQPASRFAIIHLRQQFNSSLIEHQAKPTGLCEIRRAIYDQCFDELIRQVTISCVEQGLLLFRIRNELKMTLLFYRRAYDSAVKFGLRKANKIERHSQESALLDTNTCVGGQHEDKNRSETEPTDAQVDGRTVMIDQEASKRQLQLLDHYERELIKKDTIIAQQRRTIKALSQQYIDGVSGSL